MKLKFKIKRFKRTQLYKKFKNFPKVHLKCSTSNLYVSLTNKFNKLITCSSSGSSGIKGNKRRKRAPQAIEKIMRNVRPHFTTHKLRHVVVVIKNRISGPAYYLVRELLLSGIVIVGFLQRKIISHNGSRLRKLKRS